jgi:hypothetical protein
MATISKTTEAEVIRRTDSGSGYVDWGAIFAGATLAAAISMSLVAFGSALGLSLTSFTDSDATPALGVILAIGLWLMWLQISAALGGGYLAGRLRRRIYDAPKHEVEIRDGMHGLVVWAVGVLLGSIVAAWIATLGTMGAATVSAGAASDPQAGITDYYVDRLLRPATAPVAEGVEAPTQLAADRTTIAAETRSELGRILSSTRVTRPNSEDRAYLIQQIASRTGMSEQQATERLDNIVVVMRAQADQARRMAVMMGFITVVSLLISAVGAWWAATKGGDHRDESVDHSRFVIWR